VSATPPGPNGHRFAPAVVVDRIDIVFMIKYILRFDDGVVSLLSLPLKGIAGFFQL
jgi:hypothetical protein